MILYLTLECTTSWYTAWCWHWFSADKTNLVFWSQTKGPLKSAQEFICGPNVRRALTFWEILDGKSELVRDPDVWWPWKIKVKSIGTEFKFFTSTKALNSTVPLKCYCYIKAFRIFDKNLFRFADSDEHDLNKILGHIYRKTTLTWLPRYSVLAVVVTQRQKWKQLPTTWIKLHKVFLLKHRIDAHDTWDLRT